MPARDIMVVLSDGSERKMSVEEMVRAQENVIKAMLVLSYLLPLIIYTFTASMA